MAASIARRVLLLVVTGCLVLPMAAQSAGPVYEVVSIKPSPSGAVGTSVNIGNDRYLAENISLKQVIQYAWNLKTEDQIGGLPGWAGSAKFDIEAKMDAETIAELKQLPKSSGDQRRAMMQSLLADRLALKVHHETRELSIYLLVVAKSGLKLKSTDPADGNSGTSTYNDHMKAHGIRTVELANYLSGMLHRQVLDRTETTGKYDFELSWAGDHLQADSTAPDNAAPSLFTALQEQLGLKLEPSKGAVDTIVVDHVEPPSEN